MLMGDYSVLLKASYQTFNNQHFAIKYRTKKETADLRGGIAATCSRIL